MYLPPGPFIRFGDVFDAPFLFATYVRADASALGLKLTPAKHAKQVEATLGSGEGDTFPLYSPNIHRQAEHDFVLSHGDHARAIMLTDNCTISNLYGYDRSRARRSGRLVLAAVRDATEDEMRKSIEKPTFSRFGLEPSGFFNGGIVDLRKLVVVEKRDLAADQRVASLDKDLTALLEARWNAHIVRRGPNVVDRNADKLETLIKKQPGANPRAAEAAAAAVADTLGISWRIEGGALDDAATAADDDLAPEPPVSQLIDDLRQLATAAQSAADSLERAHVKT
ncbi:MAG: hypothetical protein ACYC1P_13285 [Gaiellaceae bacterium]